MRILLSGFILLGALSSWRFTAWGAAGSGRGLRFLFFLLAWLYSQSFWIVTALPRITSLAIPRWAELICSLSAPWLGLSLCLFLALDLARLCRLTAFSGGLRRWAAWGGTAALAALILWGIWTAARPTVVSYDLTLPSLKRPLKALTVSDFHLGSLGMPLEKLARTVDLIQREQPQIVFIPGDILDWEFNPLEDPAILEQLARIKAPLGVYACLGNHDRFGGVQRRIEETLERIGIQVLYDEVHEIPEEGLRIAGRADLSTPGGRRALADFAAPPSEGETLIVLDHNPARFSDAVSLGAALQLSGHTHNGQFFPASLLVKLFYEKPWGVLRRQDSTLFTTCGAGTWGAPVRIGSVAEIALLNLRPKGD